MRCRASGGNKRAFIRDRRKKETEQGRIEIRSLKRKKNGNLNNLKLLGNLKTIRISIRYKRYKLRAMTITIGRMAIIRRIIIRSLSQLFLTWTKNLSVSETT